MGKEKIRLRDLPSGHDGTGYIEIGGRIVEAFKIAKVEAKATAILENHQFLGERVEQNALRGIKIGGNIEYFHTTNAFIKAIRDYKNGESYPEIRLQYYTESNLNGREEISVTGVILNDTSFGKLDDSSNDSQSLSTDFTADDFAIIGKFDE